MNETVPPRPPPAGTGSPISAPHWGCPSLLLPHVCVHCSRPPAPCLVQDSLLPCRGLAKSAQSCASSPAFSRTQLHAHPRSPGRESDWPSLVLAANKLWRRGDHVACGPAPPPPPPTSGHGGRGPQGRVSCVHLVLPCLTPDRLSPQGAGASVIRTGCAQGWSELRLILDRGGCSHVSRLKLGLGFLFALRRGSRAGPRGDAGSACLDLSKDPRLRLAAPCLLTTVA